MFTSEPNTIIVAMDYPAGVAPFISATAEADLHVLADDGCPHHEEAAPERN